MALSSFKLRTFGVALFLFSVADANAQCPDGTPPPCRSAISGLVARRANPALDRRAWIVVPFGNVMKAPDLDWLRDASVNLLSLDLGRWTDVHVIPDKRVGDLVRELPAGHAESALTLADGMSIARRAGAGMLVMGDFFRVGKGARLVANVFDVSTGAKVRSAEQQSTVQDSLLTAFTPLARAVLAVPAPVDAKLGELGTTNLDAYQAYLLGVKAFHHFDLADARKQLLRALALDSTFALAHLELSNVIVWGEGTPVEEKAHALAARRLGTKLPARERMLIDARVATVDSDYPRACAIGKSLVDRDSTDIEALQILGDCSQNDAGGARSATDSMSTIFRSSWNTAVRSFARILDLDPSYYLAFEPIIEIYGNHQRSSSVCRGEGAPCEPRIAIVMRAGDSLVTVAIPSRGESWTAQRKRAQAEKPRVANLLKAREIAQRWLDADTSSERAHAALGRVELARGDLAAADAQFKYVTPKATLANITALRAMTEVAAKLGHGAQARALFDSVVKAYPDRPSVAAQRGGVELMFGRFKRIDANLPIVVQRLGPEAMAYAREVGHALLGLPRDSLAQYELAYFKRMRDSTCDVVCRLGRLDATLKFLPRLPRSEWPPVDGNSYSGQLRVPVALMRGDTALLRNAALYEETESRLNTDMSWPEYGYSVLAAEGYLALHDSVSALRMARFFVDTAMVRMPLDPPFINTVVRMPPTALWPRMMLLRADLAAAAGQKVEARVWYARVLDLWADADPELQPTILRIKAAVAALGP